MSDVPAADQSPAPESRRRRRRASAAQGAPPAAPVPGPQAAPGGAPAEAQPKPEQRSERRRTTQSARDSGERGLRDLVGAGRSQLGVDGALRGRDVNRPTDEDLAEAERDVQLVRRHWTPPNERG